MEEKILQAIVELRSEMTGLRSEMTGLRSEMNDRFSDVDDRLARQEKQLTHQDEQFTLLYQFTQDGFNRLDEKIDATRDELKQDMSHVYDLVDIDVKQRETEVHERAAMSLQLNRLEEEVGELRRHPA
jgi:seryl-tRNA synthetase